MRYAVDRIEENFVVCECIDTKEIIELDLDILNFDVKEGDIIVFKNNEYFKDEKSKEDRLKSIQEKFNKLKK